MNASTELPLSAKAKKTQHLQALFKEMQRSGLAVIPTHLDKPFITLQDGLFADRPIFISMDSGELIKVVIVYHEYKYDNTIVDRRNGIKTAKDIFEFYHDIQVGDYSKVSKSMHGIKLPTLSLYYQNSTTANAVQVTVTARYNYSAFLFNFDTLLEEINERLNTLTRAIAMDNKGEGRNLRWEKEVLVNKQWWSH